VNVVALFLALLIQMRNNENTSLHTSYNYFRKRFHDYMAGLSDLAFAVSPSQADERTGFCFLLAR